MKRIIVLLIAAASTAACGPEFPDRIRPGSGANPSAVAAASDVSIRRIGSAHYQDAASTATGISPDGRFLLIGDTAPAWVARRLRAIDLSSGEIHQVADEYVALAAGAVYSRDGRHVAYAYRDWSVPHLELRLAAADGSEARTLWRREGLFRVLDVSADGTRILVRPALEDESSEFGVVTTASGVYAQLRWLGWGAPNGARLSGDGRFIAYDRRDDAGRSDRDLYVLAVNGSRDERITNDGGRKTLLGWSTADDALYYATAEQDGSSRIWRLPVSAGRANGKPQLVRADLWKFRTLRGGLAGDVLYYFTGGTHSGVLYDLAVDLETGRAVGEPQPVSGSRDAWGPNHAAWSPDGARVAYGFDSPRRIAIRSAATGDVTTYAPRLEQIHLVRWTSDGNSLLLGGYSGRGQGGFFHYDLASGSLTPLAATYDGDGPVVDAAGTTLYFAADDRGAIMARDLATGAERTVLRGGPFLYPAAVSPDGTRIAYFRGNVHNALLVGGALEVASVNGGEPVVLFADAGSNPDRLHRYSKVAWSPDGRHVLFTTHAPDAAQRTTHRTEFGRQQIRVVPVSGGESKVLYSVDDMPLRLTGLAVRPDGRRILFTGGGDPDERVEFWAMDLAPRLQDAATGVRP
jgi:Tol biopolymer transport system component